MRAALFLVCFAACSTDVVESSAPPPASVRARLVEDTMTRLILSAEDSAGTITVQRKISGGWETGLADLAVDFGEVVASADPVTGEVTIEKLSIALEPIEIPASVFNREASLSHVRAELETPAIVKTTWTDDNTAHLTAMLDLAFSWSLTVEGNTSGLGAPDLPPLALEIEVTGNGSVVRAHVDAGAGGELWSWAGLLKLEDLALTLAAQTK
jgi:hypothetical protein